MNKFQYKIAQFMIGRRGFDPFSRDLMILAMILIVLDLIIPGDFVLAVRLNGFEKTAGSYHCGDGFAQLFLHAVNEAVYHGSMAVDEAGLDALDGVTGDDLGRSFQFDAGQLAGLVGQAVGGDP